MSPSTTCTQPSIINSIEKKEKLNQNYPKEEPIVLFAWGKLWVKWDTRSTKLLAHR